MNVIISKTVYLQLGFLLFESAESTLSNLEEQHNVPHDWSDKGYKGTVVNQVLPYLHRGLIETLCTIPLIKEFSS